MTRYTFFSSQHVLNLELSQILTRAEAREVIVRWSDRIMGGVTVFTGDTQVHELERQYAQCCLEFEAYRDFEFLCKTLHAPLSTDLYCNLQRKGRHVGKG